MKRVILTATIFALSFIAVKAQDFVGKVPANFSVQLNFDQGWPFATPAVKPADQKEEGEAYEYKLSQGKNTASLFFTLCKGPNGNLYSFSKKLSCLDFRRPEEQPDNCGYIKLPAVTDRYIKQVDITIATKDATILLCSAPQKSKKGENFVASIKVPDHGTGSAVLTTEHIAVGAPLYVYRTTSGAFRITSIKISYASVKSKGKTR